MSKHKILKISMLSLLILVLILPMSALLFCQDSQTSESYDYVALGDSYAAGQTPYGEAVGYSYTDMIKEELERAGILESYQKKGVSGYTTADIMKQLPSIKGLLYRADLVTIDIGINDILNLSEFAAYRSNPSTKAYDALQEAVIKKVPKIETNIVAIIQGIRAANPYFDPQIYVMGYFNAFPKSPEFLPVIEKLNDSISAAAVKTDATYVDTMAAVDEKLEEYFPGDIHPTVQGYDAIAEEFWGVIYEDFIAKISDVSLPYDINGHWAESSIKKYMIKGIITGFEDGSFKPNLAITRAEFVTILNKYFNLTATADIRFIDIPENAWYQTEIQKAVKDGYVSGYPDNSFRANETVTRQEAAVMTAKVMHLELSGEEYETVRFRDEEDIPAWSADSFKALIRYGVFKGYPDNRIGYQEILTRAEALSMLDNITVFIDNNVPEK